MTEPPRPAQLRSNPRAHWYVVGTVCVGALMSQLDASIVSIALPNIGTDLHAGVSLVKWVSLSYMLMLLAALVLVGRISDVAGRKLLYTHGFAVFMLGSALCGLAPSLYWLIAARLLQGLGAAMLQANSVALIRQAMPPGELARGIGIQGAAQAIGLAAGPALGGLLVALGGWRLIFLVNLPIGMVGLLLGRLLLPRSRHEVRTQTAEQGNALALLRVPAISFGLAGGFISYMTMFGALFVIPYYLLAAHVSSTLAGLQLACLPIALGCLALFSSHRSAPNRTRCWRSGGLALAGLGLLELALIHDGPGRLLGLALAGAGLGAFTPANNSSVMGAGPLWRAGVLGGALNMTRTLGAIAGVTLSSVLYVKASGHVALTSSLAASGDGLTLSLSVLGALALLSAAVLLREPAAEPVLER